MYSSTSEPGLSTSCKRTISYNCAKHNRSQVNDSLVSYLLYYVYHVVNVLPVRGDMIVPLKKGARRLS